MNYFVRRDVSNCPQISSEDRGVNEKEWILDGNKEALFKETQIKDNGESTYADYAESIVTDICNLLNWPCAQNELVTRNGKNGILSYNFCNKDEEEQNDIGSVIQNVRISFDSKSMKDNKTKESYCIEMILEALEAICKNKTEFANVRRSFLIDTLIDSLIDHYDRNPSNLSILRSAKGIRLSPKYDNGTSLSISVPKEALEEYLEFSENETEVHKNMREKINSKIGYLGRKYVKYEDLETYIFNYYNEDVSDFISTIKEKLTDENIELILNQDKYADLSNIHKAIIAGKLRTNRDTMLERFSIISKKIVIDNIIYNKAARNNFLNHVQKGNIQAILPEYNLCIGVKDSNTDYDKTLDFQIPEKIQSIVDIIPLSRYFRIPVQSLTKREKSLLKWVAIIESIQKVNPNQNVFDDITTRLGFVPEDISTMKSVIKDKFKDENDIFEAREIIYGEDGIGEKNINLYLSKKFIDATIMRTDIREERFDSLRTFSETMHEAVELEHIAKEKLPFKTRTFEKFGLTNKEQILEIKFELAKAYKKNSRITRSELYELNRTLCAAKLGTTKQEIARGIFVDKDTISEINNNTYILEDGKKLVLINRSIKLNKIAITMGIDYFGQILQHPSGEGITAYFIAKKGVDFPEKFQKYANDFYEKFKTKYNDGSIKFIPANGKKSVSCFIVSSLSDANAKIPDMTVQKMFEKVRELFGVKSKEKIHDD